MTLIRSIQRSVLLLGLLTAACLDGAVRKRFFGMKTGPQGAVWVHGWCRRIVAILKIGYEIRGPLAEASKGSQVIVSNHLSYLDILIYSAATPFIMVAKTEVRSWPLIGWITAQAGTIYVQRADVKGGQTQSHEEVNRLMAEAFQTGLPVLFFPEGTTTDGNIVLPFRRGLFNSVMEYRLPVRAASVSYKMNEQNPGASIENCVCYWGDMVFAPHLFRALGLRGLHADVQFDDHLVSGEDRFALASNAQERVRQIYGSQVGRHFPQASTFQGGIPIEGPVS